jgi:UDP:flavonoid glycosyltransferase YjiC (YdhE family)
LIDALADLDIELVALLPAGSWDDRRPLPDNARLVDFAPLSALLPTCAAMIDHGGWGTVNTGLSHGVPQVVVPSWFDSPLVASRLAERGAALALSGEAGDAQSVRESLRRILAESDFTRAAGRIRDEINAMPVPRNIVTQIEDRTTNHRNRYTNL